MTAGLNELGTIMGRGSGGEIKDENDEKGATDLINVL